MLARVGKGAGTHAFTLIEVFLVLSAIAILAGAGIYAVSSSLETSRESKLEHDVAVVNQAVNVFLANGGVLPSESGDHPDMETAVLTALKAEATLESGATLPGMTGSFIDRRITTEWQGESEAGSSRLRAAWNAAQNRFITRRTGDPGIRNFALDDALALVDYGTMERETAIAFAPDGGWVWEYADATPDSPPTLGGGPGTTDPDTERNFLDMPSFSPPPGHYPTAAYDLSVNITNPNPSGVSQIYYSVNGAAYVPYHGGAVSIAPLATLSAFATPTEPEWVRSGIASGQYTAINQPVLDWDINPDFAAGMTYAQAGGAMLNTPVTEPPPARILLVNSDEIPGGLQSSSNFTIKWTKDGSDPLDSETASDVPAFSGGYVPYEVDISLGGWGELTTLNFNAIAQAINTATFIDSEPADAVIPMVSTPLAPPIINPPTGIRIANLPITIFPQPGGQYPEGYRIYYTTDGTDPGVDASGNPVTGTPYQGTFQQAPVDGEMVQIAARIYGPEGFGQWFEASPLMVAQYFAAGGELIGAVVNRATLNANSRFTGSIVLNQPVSGDFIMNSNAKIFQGNLYVPGTPQVQMHQNAVIQGREFLFDGTEIVPASNTQQIVDLNGDPLPDNYKIIMNANTLIEGKIYRRVDLPIAIPELDPMPNLSGAQSINLNSGQQTLPPGNYGNLNTSSNTKFIFGVEGSSEPAVYNINSINLNSNSTIEIVGPVIINLQNGMSIGSNTTLGNPNDSSLLQLNIHNGGLTLNSNSQAYAHVMAPNHNVIVNSNALLQGAIVADQLIMNANSDLDATPQAAVGL